MCGRSILKAGKTEPAEARTSLPNSHSPEKIYQYPKPQFNKEYS